MENNHRTALKSLCKRYNKDKHFQGQMQRVFTAFLRHPKTMLAVSVETGIRTSNITRYVAKWRKQSRIKTIRKGVCPISKSTGVQFLTTNPDLFPIVKPSKPKGNE